MKIRDIIEKNRRNGSRQIAVLVDPDKANEENIKSLAGLANYAQVDFFLVGGSLLTSGSIDACIEILRKHTNKPIILFPGSPNQISEKADAILLLSLISGRNAELLIGRHVEAAPMLKKCGLELLPTGYMLIESGKTTTAHYISQTMPIPSDKPEIAAITALAGEQLGLQYIYLDGGSGAANHVPEALVKAVRDQISCPLIVGGGIRNADDAIALCKAGADIVVLGNALEKDPALLAGISEAIHSV